MKPIKIIDWIWTVSGWFLLVAVVQVLVSCGVVARYKSDLGNETVVGDYTNFNPNDPNAILPPLPTSAPLVLPKTAKNYFNQVVVPAFNNNCTACHNDPRFPGEGPLTIFSYTSAVNFVINGTSSEENQLIWKMRAKVPHPGADRCPDPQGTSASPCFEVKNWYAMEAIERGTSGGAGPLGSFTEVAADGNIYGWALDTKSLTTATQVQFYANGPKGTGTLIGTTSANLPSPNLNFQGNHGFKFAIPAAYRDRTNHVLYAYALDATATQNSALSGGPKNFLLYATTAAGLAYYNNTVRPALTASCQGCHNVGADTIYLYDSAFYYLLGYPKPNEGGTAVNNTFVQKASGGLNHGGLNVCGGVNGNPCNLLQTWWGLEFN